MEIAWSQSIYMWWLGRKSPKSDKNNLHIQNTAWKKYSIQVQFQYNMCFIYFIFFFRCFHLLLKSLCRRNQHSMVFQVPYARTDIYMYSFFPNTISDWNALPGYIIASTESAEDYVTRFTSRVRSRDFAIVWPREWMSIDVSPVKYSDSDSCFVFALALASRISPLVTSIALHNVLIVSSAVSHSLLLEVLPTADSSRRRLKTLKIIHCS